MLKKAWSYLILFAVAVLVITLVVDAIRPYLGFIGIAIIIVAVVLILRALWKRKRLF